ncbi:MAG: tetratricopeptide repeat protein [Lautropia sp.]|nr:tetratricopeptide repeat protein [Lautropia sp.]
MPRVPRDAGEAESLVHAARAAERVYAFSQATDLYDRALKVLNLAMPRSPERVCEVLLLKEAALERLGRRADQISSIDEALAVAEPLGDASRLATILLRRAGACTYLGCHTEARGAAERALAVYRGIGDQPGEAEALRELGFVHWHAEEHAAALRYARDALALHRRLGDVAGEASALHNLAEIHRGLGSPRLALDWYEQALRLHWAAQNHEGEILSLFGMASALHQAGDLSGATGKCKAALQLSELHGVRTMQSRALHALAMQHAAQSDLDSALTFLRRAIEVDRAIGYAHALGHDLVDLSAIHLRRAERVEARMALREALVWFDFTEDHDAQASTRVRLSDIGTDRETLPPLAVLRYGVKSHLALGEGKVYCEFESPLGARLRG